MADVPSKKIAILGSTGSVGRQALDVVRSHANLMQIEVLTAGNQADLLITQAREFLPNAVVIADETKYLYVKDALHSLPIKVFAGTEALEQIVTFDSVDIVLNALLGMPGLAPGIAALKAGKVLAQANKEALVVAGKLLSDICSEHRAAIIPVDSEHSAVFQCFLGEDFHAIHRVILTGSGGPFRGKKKEQLAGVTKKDALKHPNWVMGNKITVDSATLMNKGLEVIAARWFFGLRPEQIEVVIHPQSIVHGMVEYADGTVKAVMGYPDMRIPIQYAMTFPDRLPRTDPRLSLHDIGELSFEPPDTKTFPCLELARKTVITGGNAPCILNAANEVAVQAFLDGNLHFMQIPALIEKCLAEIDHMNNPAIQDLYATDAETRTYAHELVKNSHSL